MPESDQSEDDSIRITVTALTRADVIAAAGRIGKGFGKKPDRTSEIRPVAGGRLGQTLAFPAAVVAARTPRSASKAGTGEKAKATSDQQVAVVEASIALQPGEDIVNIALAGTGKTSTLVECASARRKGRVLYLAFNTSIVEEAKGRFPSNTKTGTIHSIAKSMVPEAHGREIGRIDLNQLISVAGIPDRVANHPRRALAWLVHGTMMNFSNDDALEIGVNHVPPDVNVRLAKETRRVAELAQKGWDAVLDGRLVLPHFAYLKMWHLALASGRRDGPEYDLVLLDEAQDVNPVIAAIVDLLGYPLIRCGDPFQSIYSWRGAVDALTTGKGKRLSLTRSYRFGQNIAGLANRILGMHPDFYTPPLMKLEGLAEDLPIGQGATADAVLCRSNAGLLTEAAAAIMKNAGPIHVVGGVEEIKRLVDDACALKSHQRPRGTEFAAFASWFEVMQSVEAGTAGEVAQIAKFVDQRGVGEATHMVETIGNSCVPEADARLVISTIHKAKGREWDSVRLAADNRSAEDIGKMYAKAKTRKASGPTMEEVNLLYVAVTRARKSVRLPPDLMPMADPTFRFQWPQKSS